MTTLESPYFRTVNLWYQALNDAVTEKPNPDGIFYNKVRTVELCALAVFAAASLAFALVRPQRCIHWIASLQNPYIATLAALIAFSFYQIHKTIANSQEPLTIAPEQRFLDLQKIFLQFSAEAPLTDSDSEYKAMSLNETEIIISSYFYCKLNELKELIKKIDSFSNEHRPEEFALAYNNHVNSLKRQAFEQKIYLIFIATLLKQVVEQKDDSLFRSAVDNCQLNIEQEIGNYLIIQEPLFEHSNYNYAFHFLNNHPYKEIKKNEINEFNNGDTIDSLAERLLDAIKIAQSLSDQQ